jgi:hypothetical protein
MNKALKTFEKAREVKLVEIFNEKLEKRCQKMSMAEKNMKKLYGFDPTEMNE